MDVADDDHPVGGGVPAMCGFEIWLDMTPKGSPDRRLRLLNFVSQILLQGLHTVAPGIFVDSSILTAEYWVHFPDRARWPCIVLPPEIATVISNDRPWIQQVSHILTSAWRITGIQKPLDFGGIVHTAGNKHYWTGVFSLPGDGDNAISSQQWTMELYGTRISDRREKVATSWSRAELGRLWECGTQAQGLFPLPEYPEEATSCSWSQNGYDCSLEALASQQARLCNSPRTLFTNPCTLHGRLYLLDSALTFLKMAMETISCELLDNDDQVAILDLQDYFQMPGSDVLIQDEHSVMINICSFLDEHDYDFGAFLDLQNQAWFTDRLRSSIMQEKCTCKSGRFGW